MRRFFAKVLTFLGALVCLAIFGQSAGASTGKIPEIRIDSGWIKGQHITSDKGSFDEFLGIPFSNPPVGKLRWQKPTPVTPWDGMRDATSYSQHCTQFLSAAYPLLGMASGKHGEDCLYLNIWVPNGVDPEANLPVMVFFYGGSYIVGTGEMYPGSELALQGNVIVVNFNYRVAALGWLNSGGDGVLPGNYGLWDAKAALQWVQRNIAKFGGDPGRVTIFGQSAGASMVSYSVVSPQFEGLFQRAIAISGGSTEINRRSKDNLLTLSSIFRCGTNDNREIVDCLMDVDNKKLDFWSIIGEQVLNDRMPVFGPIFDGEMVIGDPVELYAAGHGKDIELITGATHHDGAGFILRNPFALRAIGDRLNAAATPQKLEEYVENFFGFANNSESLSETIFDLYPEMNSSDVLTRTLAATNWCTDTRFAGPAFYEASHHSKYAEKTYHYSYKFRHSFLAGYPDWVEGSHIDDLYTVFGDVYLSKYRKVYLRRRWLQEDYDIHENWVGYLSNFAHTGNPNEGQFNVPVEWPKFTEENERLVVSGEISVDNVDEEQADLYNFLVVDLRDEVERPISSGQFIKSDNLISKAVSLIDTFWDDIKGESLSDRTLHNELKEIMEKLIDTMKL